MDIKKLKVPKSNEPRRTPKGKFKSLSCSALASWMIKSRKGNVRKIVGSLNQQIVFNRKRNPSYAKKMKCARNKAVARLKKK